MRVPFTRDTPRHGDDDADLEALASGPAIARYIAERGTPAASSADVLALSRRGHPDAVSGIRQAGRDLGEVLATCVNLFNPSVVVLSGFLAALHRGASAHGAADLLGDVVRSSRAGVQVVEAQLGADQLLVGAAELVFADLIADPARAL